MTEQRFFHYDDDSRKEEDCPAEGRPGHCWHRGMCTYTSYPSQHDEMCCFCGETVRVQDPPIYLGALATDHETHGKFAPKYWLMNGFGGAPTQEGE